MAAPFRGNTVIVKFARHFTASIALALLLANLVAAQGVTASAERGTAALAYAPQTEALYKSDGRALYRSDGGGKEWKRLSLPRPAEAGGVAALAVSPAGAGALYLGGRGVGVLKSIDAGKSWVAIGEGLPNAEVVALAAHSSAADTVYAVLAGKGIYRSEDGGRRWRMVDKGPQAELRSFIHSGMEGSMQSGWLFAATDKGVYRAMDCFCGFRVAGNLPGPVSAVTYDPKQPKELYAAVGKDVFGTVNGGEEWEAAASPGSEIGCIGHVLGAILTVSAASGTVSNGAVLLAVYSLGLGLPFLVAAVFTDAFLARMPVMRRLGRPLQLFAGGTMVLMGLAMITGYMSAFSFWLLAAFPVLGTLG